MSFCRNTAAVPMNTLKPAAEHAMQYTCNRVCRIDYISLDAPSGIATLHCAAKHDVDMSVNTRIDHWPVVATIDVLQFCSHTTRDTPPSKQRWFQTKPARPFVVDEFLDTLSGVLPPRGAICSDPLATRSNSVRGTATSYLFEEPDDAPFPYHDGKNVGEPFSSRQAGDVRGSSHCGAYVDGPGVHAARQENGLMEDRRHQWLTLA